MDADYSETSPVVQTTHGRVRGTLLTSLYDESFYAFDGIPYAVPPLGSLRFKEPHDIRPWHGIRDCSRPQNKCIQVSTYTKQVEGSEDCLYLDVSVKRLQSEKLLPIMVYVHGGAFKGGDATRRAWSPEYFMQQDVIYISISHRLGPFGFLSFADPSLEIPGNAGLKDIVLALRWIKANAGNFNGDADNITLFGHSSGGVSVHLLMLSPQTEQLFHKAIIMAGYASESNRLPNMEYRLAKHLGYEGENKDSDVCDFIRKADPRLVASADFFTDAERAEGMQLAFVPCVEPYATPTAMLLGEPIELQRTAWSNRLPIMLGSTSTEGLFFTSMFEKQPQMLSGYKQNPYRALPQSLQRRCPTGLRRQLGQALLQEFHAGRDLSIARMVQLISSNMDHSEHRVLHARVAYAQAPTYLYRFDFDSPDFNFYRIRFGGPEIRGVGHVDELCYIFKIPATFKLEKSRPEYTAICRMVAMFTEFALRSNPNAPLTQPLVDWQPISRFGPRMCLNINEELTMIAQPRAEKLKFLDRLYEQASMPLF